MYFLSNVQFQNEQVDKWMKRLYKALKKAHQFDVVRAKNKDIRIALCSDDYSLSCY